MRRDQIVKAFWVCSIMLLLADLTLAQSTQTPSIDNLNEVRVDDLTDDQIQQFLDKVEESGLSQQQLEILAKQRGMSSTEIAKLRTRILNLRTKKPGDQQATDQGDLNRLRQDPLDDVEQDQFAFFEQLVLPDSLKDDELEIFGLSIFRNANINFQPSVNIPTPKDYTLGPGDEVIIDIYGASEQSYQEVISPDGSILIPNLGPLYLSGLPIEKAKDKIVARLSNIYSGLRAYGNNPPNTFAQISLGQLRSIKVIVVGEVVQPGTYTTSSLSGVFNALYYAGGPTETGSLRKVDILRDGKVLKSADLYEGLIDGKINKQLKLQDEDVILIRPYLNRVVLDGEVKRPAIYELKPGETVADLLRFAGGFSEHAYKDIINISRKGAQRRSISTVGQDEFGNAEIQNGDEIMIEPIRNFYTNRTIIEGAVNRPGEYEITEGFTLKSLIKVSGGLREDAFMGRAIIIRQNDDFTLTSLSIHLGDLMGGTVADPPLKPEDFVKVSSIFDLAETRTVTIEGEVNNPGQFSYVDNLTVEDIVTLAGGLRASASNSSIEVARRISDNGDISVISQITSIPIRKDLELGEGASTFRLTPFDLVLVRKSAGYKEQVVVEVEGEVMNVGRYALEKRVERISDLILRTGGLTPYAYPEGATLIRRTEFYESPEEKIEEARRLLETKINAKQQGLELEDLSAVSGNTGLSTQGDAASQIKKEAFEILQEQDSLLKNVRLKERESIGIDLVNILKSPGSKYDLILQEGDIVSIPKQLQTVRLQGELLYPSTVRFDETYGFKDFISLSGGFSDNAKKGKSYVVYANGAVARTKSFFGIRNYPDVDPGAEIFVPKKPEKRKLSPTEIVAIASGLGTIALIINNLSSN
ncbi:MAG: SLBB domain-containing protein [Cyclobacteriaceae bacterium]